MCVCLLTAVWVTYSQLLGYAKVVGTLVRAMRVLAVAIRAVPRAARVVRLAAVFIRSYEGRRRSKDLHEASIIIQRRAGRHMALKVRLLYGAVFVLCGEVWCGVVRCGPVQCGM